MNLHFNKITIHNFLSFGDAEVILADRGYTLISGINNNPRDSAKSNGSGKSTIFSALSFVLTGETIQGLSSNLSNMFSPGDMYVSLDFNCNSDNYVVTRYRYENGKADLTISINGEDKSGKGIRESEAILAQYLPDLTSELIGEVIIVGQGMPHKFSNNSPAGRKELLEKLSHSDFMLEDIKTRLENRTSEVKLNKDNLEKTKIELDTRKSVYTRSLSEVNNKLVNYEVTPDFDGEIKKLDDEINSREAKNKEAQDIILTLNEDLLKLNSDLFNMKDLLNKELQDEQTVFNSINLDLTAKLAENRATTKSLETEITRLSSIKDICPTCGQKLPHVHKPDISSQVSEKERLLEEYSKLSENSKQLSENHNDKVERINNKYKDALTEIQTTIKDKESEVTANNTIINTNNSIIKTLNINLNSWIKDKENFEHVKRELLNEQKNLENQISGIDNDLLYNIKETAEITEHLNVLSKISTLIKRDFRGILLSNIIKYLDMKCKEYSKEIFGTEDLDFLLEGNNINITYCKKALEALSGGEQQKVDLILQFAIRDMMQQYTGFRSNILVLDEILDNLDSVGCDQVLNFITNRLSDIESIFIISHHADTLNICNDSEITVIKNNQGISSIL